MNPGDLKYTFTNKDGVEETAVIPAEIIRTARREKIPTKTAIQKYLAGEGLIEETAVEETAKVKKTRTRKPNDTKRAIVNLLADAATGAYGEVEITNPERQFRFQIDGKTYEVTLVQKRG